MQQKKRTLPRSLLSNAAATFQKRNVFTLPLAGILGRGKSKPYQLKTIPGTSFNAEFKYGPEENTAPGQADLLDTVTAQESPLESKNIVLIY